MSSKEDPGTPATAPRDPLKPTNTGGRIERSDGARKKWQRTLQALIDRPHLHRFTAERDPAIADHTLPSTVSEIQKRGVRVDRRLVKLPGYGGEVALVAEYSLDEEQRGIARQILWKAGSSGR